MLTTKEEEEKAKMQNNNNNENIFQFFLDYQQAKNTARAQA